MIRPASGPTPSCRSTAATRPTDFTIHVRDIRAYTGAGWLVPLCGDIRQMPGLGVNPAAHNVGPLPDGRVVGLF